MSLGKRLIKLREDRGLYQKDIAGLLGVSNQTISDYEKDKKKPRYEKIEIIANYFGVTTDYLLGADSSIDELETVFPEGVKVLRRASKELTPEAKDQMIKLMKAFLEK